MPASIKQIRDARARLVRALGRCQSLSNCRQQWSVFIRTRDGNRCLQCGSSRELAAHHIFRKSFLTKAEFEPGNGITLCRKCHKGIHLGFNGRPDLSLPMDAQGGEKAEDITLLLELLVRESRNIPEFADDFYFLSDSTLGTISLLQGFDPFTRLPGSRVEHAFQVWNQAPADSRDAVLSANGFAPFNDPLQPGIHVVFDDNP